MTKCPSLLIPQPTMASLCFSILFGILTHVCFQICRHIGRCCSSNPIFFPELLNIFLIVKNMTESVSLIISKFYKKVRVNAECRQRHFDFTKTFQKHTFCFVLSCFITSFLTSHV